MGNILKLIVKFHFLILFLILEIISLGMVITANKSKSALIFNSANSISGYFFEKVTEYTDYFNLREENKKLIEENNQLKNILYSGNSDTSKFQNYGDTLRKRIQYLYKTAQVINNSVYHQNNFFTINKGKLDGVDKDMAVISPAGVAGIIVDATDHFASAISLLNKKIGISAKVKYNHYYGTLIWNGKDYTKAELNEIPNHVSIDIGDTVVTSGYSAIFPPEIPIGIIHNFKLKGTDNFYLIDVQLFTDFKALKNIYVIKNQFQQEQRIVEKYNKNDY